MGQGSGCPRQDWIRVPPESEALANVISSPAEHFIENIYITDFCRQSVIDSGVH
jgi:hypothetical protein